MSDSSDSGSRSKRSEIWVKDFSPKSAQHFREQVIERTYNNQEVPVVIYIDSFGGQVDSLSKMIATMDEFPNPMITVCMGKAMSCGAILLSHGDYRYCDKHSRVHIHDISHGSIGDVHDVWADATEGRRMSRYWLGILAKNCGMDSYDDIRSIIRSRDGRDIYMSAQEAVNFGIVDEVGTPVVVPAVQYGIGTRDVQKCVLEGEKVKKRTAKKKTTRKKKAKKKTRKKTKRK